MVRNNHVRDTTYAGIMLGWVAGILRPPTPAPWQYVVDSNLVEDKMIFTCSIYVKMSAVAERKAMERCEGMRTSKGIKNPCRVVRE